MQCQMRWRHGGVLDTQRMRMMMMMMMMVMVMPYNPAHMPGFGLGFGLGKEEMGRHKEEKGKEL
jgi:hypothetical protein